MGKIRHVAVAARALVLRGLFRGDFGHAARRILDQRLEAEFLGSKVGSAYGVGRAEKARILRRIKAACERIECATSWQAHVVLATAILRTPRDQPGAIVECGCYRGGSTTSLSLVARAVGRKLIVCDSFEGLPKDDGTVHRYPHIRAYGYYKSGMYRAALEQVRENIRRYGCLEVCEFVPGYFCDTLASVPAPIAFAFLDVDLLSSLRDCILHLWPKLVDGGYMYTDDSADMEVVRIWFDDAWWQPNLGERAPGYVGSGCGLPELGGDSSLGFAQKVWDVTTSYQKVRWLEYPDAQAPSAGTSRSGLALGGILHRSSAESSD